MDIRQLRNFLAVAELSSFTRAAESLHLSQPALSHSVAQLERELGTRLFERKKRAIELTTSGEALVPAARRAVRALDDAQQAIAEVEGLLGGRVDMTAPPALRSFPMARIVAQFRADHPRVRVRVNEAEDSRDAGERVLDGRAEVGLIDLTQAPPGLVQHRLMEARICLVVFTPNVELDETVRLSDLAHLPFVSSPRGTGIHQMMDAAGLADSIVVEARSVDSILQHAVASQLCALVIEPYADIARKTGGRVHELRPAETRQIGLVTRTGPTSAAVRELVQLAVPATRPVEVRTP
jgi:DNA-binding transcriptional LysR family regulator